MHHLHPSRLLLLLTLAACGTTSGHERTQDLGGRFASLAGDLGTLKQQVDSALQGLDTLTQNGDAVSAYNQIATAATEIGPLMDQVRSVTASSTTTGKEHFAAWSGQNSAIQDAELRGRANARQSELASLMTSTTTTIDAAVGMGTGFQQSLSDLQKYLSNDLSPTGIGNAADLIARIRGDGGRFSSSLESAMQDASHLATKLGS